MRNDREIVHFIELEYQTKQRRAKIEQEKRKNNIYALYPTLQQIDDEINTRYLNILKNSVTTNDSDKSKLENEIEALKIKRAKYVIENKIDISQMDIKYQCNMCKDTGVVVINGKTQRCQCFINRYNAISYENTNMMDLIKQNNFNLFNLSIFDDTTKYRDMTARDFMQKIRDKSYSFIDNFDDTNTKSMVFYGSTGLGKTFLCLCIADKLMKKKKNVLYDSAISMFDKLSSYEFSPQKSENEYKTYHHLVYECDLLIIDDLGTEITNSFVKKELFEIVNARINYNKKTIISTNLDNFDMQERYEERIFSRFSSNYNMYNFVGKDIRMFKK